MTEIRLYSSPWKAIRLILLCSLFVILGVFLLTKTDSPKWIAQVNICFFGLGFPIGLIQLFDKRPQIIINEIGIFDRTTRLDFIKWNVIKSAYTIDIYRQIFICLVVDEKYKPSKKKGRVYKQVVKFNEAIGAQEINLSLGKIQVDAEKLTKFILLLIYSEQTGQDKNDLIKKYVA